MEQPRRVSLSYSLKNIPTSSANSYRKHFVPPYSFVFLLYVFVVSSTFWYTGTFVVCVCIIEFCAALLLLSTLAHRRWLGTCLDFSTHKCQVISE